jgi:chitinase
MTYKLLFLILFLSVAQTGNGQSSTPVFRVVGYYSLRAAMTPEAKKIPFKKLTHINLWFLNPDTLGNFTQDFSALAPFIAAAQRKHVKVLFSIAGGSPHPYYHHLLKDAQRPVFIDHLVEIVMRYGLDGIDVDLEGGDIDENYERFVVELAIALRAQKKLITAAVAIYYKEFVTDRALAQYDFVNVMSYDRTGPWRPEKPGPHSTLLDAEQDLAYFGNEKNVPREKMTLGVPFYGYGFGPELTSPAIGMDFGKITSTFSGSQWVDQWKMPDGKILYYNGIPTMKQKTLLAKEKASGIMIWQIKGDATGSKSLLKAIYKTAHAK